MERKDALIELRDKVKAGALIHGINTAALWPPFSGDWKTARWVAKAANGSLDAAKALHEAVLPEHTVQITDMRPYGGSGAWLVSLRWNKQHTNDAADCNPARAWILAILEALIAQEPTS